MSREKIAIDIDDVLLPFVPAIAKNHNRIHGTDLTWQDFHSFNFNEVWGGTLEAAVSEVHGFLESDHLNIEPMSNAKQITQELSERYELVIVTARDPRFLESTSVWIEHHFPGIFSNVVLTCNPYASELFERKVDVCKRLGALMLIDDSLGHTTECANAGLGAILFGDYPWNQTEGELPTGVTRVSDWQAIAEHLDVESRQRI